MRAVLILISLCVTLAFGPSLLAQETRGTSPLSFAKGGRVELSPADFGTIHSDFVHDDAPAINAALNAASARGNGFVLLDPSKPYWAKTAITVPKNAALGCVAPPQKYHTGSFTADGCAVYLAPNTPLTNNGAVINARVYQDNLHFAGQPTTYHGLQEITGNYSSTGTGIINNAANAIIQDVAIAGFNLCIDENSFSQGSLRHVLGECANGIKYEAIGDFLKGLDIEVWPFYSNGTFSNGGQLFCPISNVADNGSGAWRVMCSSAPAEPMVNGDEVYIGGNGAIGIPFGALGRHNVTVVNATTFDLTGSQTTPAPTGNTGSGSSYVQVLSSQANLWPGMQFTSPCFSGTRTIQMLLRGANALLADGPATSTTTGCALNFVLGTFSAGGTPDLWFDPSGGQHGIGVEFVGSGVIACNYYVWGHDIAFQFDAGSTANQICATSIDSHPSQYRSERVGYWFKSGAFLNSISGNSQTSGGLFVLNQSNNTLQLNQVSPGRINSWTWGAVENDGGALSISGAADSDQTGVAGSFDGDVFNLSAQVLQIVNGSRFASGNFHSNISGSFSGLKVDSGSQIGNLVEVNPNLGCAGSVCSLFGAVTIDSVNGANPTSCTPSGAGTGATCAFSGGSNTSNGTVAVTTGTSPATTGTVAIVFSQPLTPITGATTTPTCIAGLDNTGTAWNAAAAQPQVSAISQTGVTFAWNNTVALANPGAYRIMYHCFGK